ncbi:UbiA family prenyltransferase [uncultured Roseobacter sp.]|uniref:UbiA family prenyltransferase n=1 Tax=uncultured Roseobacter sp. TaxID=114847 RepID=UPI0026175BAC|nr:UbiA family prenyltransferase [uncultured Roseobacter sp.]
MSNTPFPTDILIVDLDGTLLRSDMLYESFWSALGQDWRSPLRTAAALTGGKAAMKQYLSQTAGVDVTTLPYDDEVIAYVQARRAEGVRTALVTATDQSLADEIGQHLDIFDEVHGSDGKTNLKGAAKAQFLKETFKGSRFAYMGDSVADLPVWQAADLAIPVNISDALQTKVDGLGVEVEALTTTAQSLKPYLKALRPHQWLKNVLVFLPMLTAHQLTGATLMQSFAAFIAFSLIASSVYVLNDLLDLRVDRLHPRKCNRPFASGSIKIAHGTGMAGGLLLVGAGLSLVLGGGFALTMLVYYLATLAYSITLKRRAVVDICVLAGLYTMRIIAGGVATGLELSVWLLAFSIFFFFSMAAIKRQAELVDMAERGKLDVSGRGYTVKDLEIISMMSLGAGYVSVLVMALYVNSPGVVELYATPAALWGICFVLLYWISRIVMITHRGHMDDDPVLFAAKDRNSRICALVIFACAAIGAVI